MPRSTLAGSKSQPSLWTSRSSSLRSGQCAITRSGEWEEDDLAKLLQELKDQGSELDLLGFDDRELRKPARPSATKAGSRTRTTFLRCQRSRSRSQATSGFLAQVVPRLARLAILGDAGVPDTLPNLNRTAAEAEGLFPQVLMLRGAEDLDGAFVAFQEAGAGALLSLEVPRTSTYGGRIAALATAARLPTMFGRDLARYGPLLAYGTSLAAAARCNAGMVDRILKEEKPRDMPVERVSEPELVVNLQVARAIGVTILPDVLARADEIVD